MKEYAVLIAENDRKQTHVGRIEAALNREQAAAVARSLNATFAEQGLNWFAEAEEVLN